MSKLDYLLDKTRKEAVWFSKNKYSRTPVGHDIGMPQDVAKQEIKTLILDLLKESDYDQFEFVDKVSKL